MNASVNLPLAVHLSSVVEWTLYARVCPVCREQLASDNAKQCDECDQRDHDEYVLEVEGPWLALEADAEAVYESRVDMRAVQP